MQTKIIENFIAAANSKSFAAAAERLYISVPALTKQMSLLEEELRATLFNRTNRGIELTEAGKYFYDNIEPLLNSMKLVVEKTQSIHSGHKDKIVVGVYGSDINIMIPSFFKYFLPAFPTTQVSHTLVKMNELDKKLLNHEIDMCFVYGYDPKQHSNEVSHIEILEDEPICIVPKELHLSKKDIISVEDLSNSELLIVNYGNDIFHDAVRDDIKKHSYPINIIPVEEGQVDGQLKLTINPMIFIASRLSVDHSKESEYIPFEFYGQKISIGILFRKEDYNYISSTIYPTAKRAFEDALLNW